MKSKKFKAVLSAVLAMLMVLGISTNAFALSRDFRMVSSPNGMGTILQPGQTNQDSMFRGSIRVNGFPTNTAITKIEVSVGSSSNNAGIMMVHQLALGRDMIEARQPWTGVSNQEVTFNQFNGFAANGTYEIWFNASYISGYYLGTTLIPQAMRSYKNATMTVHY